MAGWKEVNKIAKKVNGQNWPKILLPQLEESSGRMESGLTGNINSAHWPRFLLQCCIFANPIFYFTTILFIYIIFAIYVQCPSISLYIHLIGPIGPVFYSNAIFAILSILFSTNLSFVLNQYLVFIGVSLCNFQRNLCRQEFWYLINVIKKTFVMNDFHQILGGNPIILFLPGLVA